MSFQGFARAVALLPVAGLHALCARAAALPGQCAVCRAWGPSRLCAHCLVRFNPPRARCERCALPVPGAARLGPMRCGACVLHPPAFDAAVAAVDYAFPWDRLLLSLKFHDAIDLAGALSALLVPAVTGSTGPPPDLLVPVPASDTRLRSRGYDPAWEIARRLSRDIGTPARADLLQRVRDTPHQLALPRDRREANVRGAFAVHPLQRRAVTGLDIALVDDVMTTGATAAEAAAALKRAGAARVQLWVVARTPRPSDLTVA